MRDNNITIVGTQIKFMLSLSLPQNLAMDDVDFSASFYTVSNRAVIIHKQEMQRIDGNNYICIVDTHNLGAGRIKCQVEALLPDSSMPDGKRKEVVYVDTEEEIRYGMYRW